jgi:hypothetical protein
MDNKERNMARSKTKPPAKPIAVPETDEHPLEIAADIMRLALLRVREEVRGIIAGEIENDKHGPAERCAYLAKETAPVARELRQSDKAERQQLEDLEAADVKVWFRMQSAGAQAALLRELVEINSPSRKSVLGSGGGR